VPANALPAVRRIRRRGEFQRVFDAGRRVHGRFLTIVFAPAPGSDSRLGIVASRKLGGAVVRNRAKRLIRQVFRTNTGPREAADLVVIPKAALLQADSAELSRDYQTLVNRVALSKP
jgi:ribonuclease P protein component